MSRQAGGNSPTRGRMPAAFSTNLGVTSGLRRPDTLRMISLRTLLSMLSISVGCLADGPAFASDPAKLEAEVSTIETEASAAEDVSAEEQPAAPELSGREIYERVLSNRHRTVFQQQRFVSADAGGNQSYSELWMRWKDMRDEDGNADRGVLSKTLAKYTAPRGVGYLVVQKEDAPNDQFAYFPSARRVRRVYLDEAILGTEFSLEDLVPRELGTATYQRREDAEHAGAACYVVDVMPEAGAGSQYSKLRTWIEKEHHVVVRTDYWDVDGLEVKRYTTGGAPIQEVEGVWLVREAKMENLIEESSTTLFVLDIEPNPVIPDSEFSSRKLEGRSR